MTERGMLMSGPMVRAILDGTKTQTRRVVKPQPIAKGDGQYLDAYCSQPKTPSNPRGMSDQWNWWLLDNRLGDSIGKCPYGQPGDRIWVREGFAPRYFDNGKPGYKADWDGKCADIVPEPKWTPSIHMPRWASRIDLDIISVRVERLNDISPYDACCEGLAPNEGNPLDPVGDFVSLWDSINGPGAWAANPWVWVYEFKRSTP